MNETELSVKVHLGFYIHLNLHLKLVGGIECLVRGTETTSSYLELKKKRSWISSLISDFQTNFKSLKSK